MRGVITSADRKAQRIADLAQAVADAVHRDARQTKRGAEPRIGAQAKTLMGRLEAAEKGPQTVPGIVVAYTQMALAMARHAPGSRTEAKTIGELVDYVDRLPSGERKKTYLNMMHDAPTGSLLERTALAGVRRVETARVPTLV